jgi:hypothetical protein
MSSGGHTSPEDVGELMLQFLDRSLLTEDESRLNQRLKTDLAARRQFSYLLLQQIQLIEIGVEQRASVEALAPQTIRGTREGEIARVRERLTSWWWPRPRFGTPTVLALVTSALVILGAAVWLVFPYRVAPILKQQADGPVTVQRAGRTFLARNGLRLQPDDLVDTDSTHPVVISYEPESTRVELSGGSRLKIHSWKWSKGLELVQGRLEATAARQRLFRPLTVRTPVAKATVEGTEFSLEVMTGLTRLDVFRGLVRLERLADGRTVKVAGGAFALAASGTNLAAQPIIGKVLRELWLNLPGDTLRDLTYDARYPNEPSWHDFPAGLGSNTNWSSPFGARMRGYLAPPANGDYEFRIAGLGQISLWLSPDEDPKGKVKIAQIVFTRNRPGDPTPDQTLARQESGPIALEAGHRYYLEALHKYGSGQDQLIITWKLPDGVEEPVPAEFLAPFVPPEGNKR